MTIKNIYPSQRPDIIYNVINGREELPVNAEYSRAKEATYTDRNGIIQTAAANVPRYDHDPETLELNGLLLEEELSNTARRTNEYQCWSKNKLCVPEPTNNAGVAPDGTTTAWQYPLAWSGLPNTLELRTDYEPLRNAEYAMLSFFVKRGSGAQASDDFVFAGGTFQKDYIDGVIFTFSSETTSEGFTAIKYPNGWYRLYRVFRGDSDGQPFVISGRLSDPSSGSGGNNLAYVWGTQIEIFRYEPKKPTSYSVNSSNFDDPQVNTREADQFALTSSQNFDPGFSLLLDSETTTREKLYSISDKSGNEIAYLKNDEGTLEWDVNGTSAQSNNDYPQVGFQLGRVRTISSFTAAGDDVNPNFLYTTGLSFPTTSAAGPGAGASKITFGVPQTLKALYIWPGQLKSSEAVALIKGDDNVIPNFSIDAEAFSFVFNTDPENTGERTITLEGVEPTAVSAGMTIDWGDGTPKQAYNKGVKPSHQYPYPGQYRIQINAQPSGFDDVKLGNNISNTITRVDQWAPQHRVGAAGFSDVDLRGILSIQRYCNQAPPFAYTNLTDISNAFQSCEALQVNNWDWIPYKLESCTNLDLAFRSICRNATDSTDALKTSFPQLQTSSALQSCFSTFANSIVRGWKDGNGNPTAQPFTNSENVTNWNNTFANCNLVDLVVNTISASTLSGAFQGNKWTISPYFNAPNCTNFSQMFLNCVDMTEMNPTIPKITYSKGETFSSAWEGCSSLETFPAGMFDITGPLRSDAFNNAFANCALTPESIENILVSLSANADKGVNTNIQLSLDGGTNAPKSEWTDAANVAYDNLIAKGWTISPQLIK